MGSGAGVAKLLTPIVGWGWDGMPVGRQWPILCLHWDPSIGKLLKLLNWVPLTYQLPGRGHCSWSEQFPCPGGVQ